MRDNTRSPEYSATRSSIARNTDDAGRGDQSTGLVIGLVLKISLDHKRPVTEAHHHVWMPPVQVVL
jgi:hypothetical protein